MVIPLRMGNPALLGLEIAYAGINVLYSLYLKRLVILDIFTIASGFVLRVFAGAYAVNVACSHWIILCVFLLALFLGFTKRQNELAVLNRNPAAHRPVLVSYSAQFISQMNMIICAAAIVCYAIYTVSPETVAKFGSDRLIYSVPFVIYGLFRYLYLSEVKNEGGSPADLLLRDRPLLICVALWIVCCAVIVYNGGPLKS
jgi:4-hydroxybenzoate polyprenyltransferase